MTFRKLFRGSSTSRSIPNRSHGDSPPPYPGISPDIKTSTLQDPPGLFRRDTFRSSPAPDPYAPLSSFDTVILVDDSGSMFGSNWSQTSNALATIAPICTRYDLNGVDIYFLNSSVRGSNVTSSNQVLELFSTVRPRGTTPTGRRLGEIFNHYLASYRRNPTIKPLNVICITDGEPTDPNALERNIVSCARELDTLMAGDRQVGVQFFQVGTDQGATEALEELDNALTEEFGIRDMVDTISWKAMNGGRGLTADGILKAVMGAVDKRLDRKRKV